MAARRPGSAPAAQPAALRPRWLLLGAGAALGALLLFQAGSREDNAPAGGKRPAFDKAAAFAQLEKQVAFGPRVPGSKGHAACRDYLVETLKPLADRVERQDFTVESGGKKLPMTNVIARWKGTGTGGDDKGVLLTAHWDTRPTADYERTAARRATPIAGANDGASGVAVLLEAARVFKASPPPVPVMIVLFDGEDVGPGLEDMFFGSRYFAEHLPADTPKKGILLDMVGDRDLQIPMESNSLQAARDVLYSVYDTAHRLGYARHFPKRIGGPIEDDHVQLHAKGLRVIDLIDFNYGPGHSWWHTLEDTPDKCSPESLKVVGDVVLEWTYTQK
ncbi:MAG: M28 family peptidase [Armatimonadota bacterium]